MKINIKFKKENESKLDDEKPLIDFFKLLLDWHHESKEQNKNDESVPKKDTP